MHTAARVFTRGLIVLLIAFTLLPIGAGQPGALAQGSTIPQRSTIPAGSTGPQEVSAGYLVLTMDSPGPERFLSTVPVMALLRELEQKQAAGDIRDYWVHPEDATVEVRGADEAAARALAKMAGVASASSAKRAGCASSAGRAESLASWTASWPAAQAADDYRVKRPIEIQMIQYTQGDRPLGSSFIRGRVTPDTPLRLEIWRGTTKIYETDGTSGADGRYYFSPHYEDTCDAKAGDWRVYPGDVVRLTAGSQYYATTAAEMIGWMDLRTGKIQVQLPPGRTVEALVYHYSDYCVVSPEYTYLSGQEQADGQYVVQIPAASFDQVAEVYALDGQGSTFIRIQPIHFDIPALNYNIIRVYFLPATSTTVTLERENGALETYSTVTDRAGRFTFRLSSPLSPGDRITAAGGGERMSYTIAPVSAAFDRASQAITGSALPGYHVRIRYLFGYSIPACRAHNDRCRWATAGEDGRFSIPAPPEWTNGYTIDVDSYDDGGDYQMGQGERSPSVYFNETALGGMYYPPNTDLTIRWQDQQGNLISTGQATTGEDGRIGSLHFLSTDHGGIVPGDRMIVTGGGVERAITLPDLKLLLSSQSGKLEGSAPAGWLAASSLRYDHLDTSLTYEDCLGAAVDGPFALAFPSLPITADTYAFVDFIDAERNLSMKWIASFSLGVLQSTGTVFGTVETAPVTSTIELWRDGQLLSSKQVEFPRPGITGPHNFSLNMSSSILPGDRVLVQSGDGIAASLDVPLLEAQAVPHSALVVGKAPANQPFRLSITREHAGWYPYESIETLSTAGADGMFSLDLSGQHWPDPDCELYNSDNSCPQYHLTYVTPELYLVDYAGPPAPPAAPDAYEPDDTPETARPYAGPQAHTQHTGDAVDWIRFTVGEHEASGQVPFQFSITNIGSDSGIRGEIRDPDGQTIALGGVVSQRHALTVTHIFTKPGAYLLALYPQQLYAAGSCSARYRLEIKSVWQPFYLPFLFMR